MALQTSGPITLLDVRTEFGGTAPDSICEYSPCIGITAGSTASLCHFYGASSGPKIGDSLEGGYYITTHCGYYLIMSPKASGEACCCWGPTTTCVANLDKDNGYVNTNTYLNSATYPAAYFTATRTINGYSDWYLPSYFELTYSGAYQNKLKMPTGECMYGHYWTSYNENCTIARVSGFYENQENFVDPKNTLNLVRAFRRKVM